MLNSKYHKECFQECLNLVRSLVSGTPSFERLIKQQDVRESIKKGLVIFFLKAADDDQEERHEVRKMFNQDFKDGELKKQMLREYVQLNGLVQRYG